MTSKLLAFSYVSGSKIVLNYSSMDETRAVTSSESR